MDGATLLIGIFVGFILGGIAMYRRENPTINNSVQPNEHPMCRCSVVQFDGDERTKQPIE